MSQRTPSYDFTVKQGVTFKRRIRIKINGVTQSLVGHVFRLFAQPDDSSSPLDFSSNNPPLADKYVIIDTTVPGDNFIEIYFDEDVTELFTWKVANFRMDLTDPNDVLRRKLRGRFVMEFK